MTLQKPYANKIFSILRYIQNTIITCHQPSFKLVVPLRTQPLGNDTFTYAVVKLSFKRTVHHINYLTNFQNTVSITDNAMK